MTILELQKLLKRKGFNPGKPDGIRGPKTDKALSTFKASIGLNPRPVLGPLTIAALKDGLKITKINSTKASGKAPPWLNLAHSHLGLREIVGRRHNSKIIEWWKKLGLPFRDDETPWCAGFMNRMVQKCNLKIPKKYRAAALGWIWNGYGTKLPGPALGAIMMIKRPGKPGSGHTTFVAGRDRKGNIMGLGGNQGNKVSINPYNPTARSAVYYWPEGYALPDKIGIEYLPIISSGGKRLKNEA